MKTKTDSPPLSSTAGSSKMTISLYETDFKIIDAIIDRARQHGRRIGASEAVRVALRNVNRTHLDFGFLEKDDLRRRRAVK